MGSLANRLLGGELLTLPEFAHDVETRLTFELPRVAVSQPRPAVLAVSCGGKAAVEFNLQSSYRAYQHDPRGKDKILKRIVQWVETSAGRG